MTQIDPNKTYTAEDIYNNGWFSWAKSRPTIAKWINADILTNNNLKAMKLGSGPQTRYYIKGENLIQYIVQMEEQLKTNQ